LTFEVRITGRYLNHIKSALAQRSTILNKSLTDSKEAVKAEQVNLFGDEVKIVRQHKLNLKLLTDTGKDEVVEKYEAGMTMTAIANQYGCHRCTIGRLLRQRGVEIREK